MTLMRVLVVLVGFLLRLLPGWTSHDLTFPSLASPLPPSRSFHPRLRIRLFVDILTLHILFIPPSISSIIPLSSCIHGVVQGKYFTRVPGWQMVLDFFIFRRLYHLVFVDLFFSFSLYQPQREFLHFSLSSCISGVAIPILMREAFMWGQFSQIGERGWAEEIKREGGKIVNSAIFSVVAALIFASLCWFLSILYY